MRIRRFALLGGLSLALHGWVAGLGGAALAAGDLPELDRRPNRSFVAAFCDGQPGDLPQAAGETIPDDVDPRSLVTPALDRTGAGVRFNSWWVDVHDPKPPFRKNPEYSPYLKEKPKTCGDWRTRRDLGEVFVRDHAAFIQFTSVATYRDLWKAWGLSERPSDFDEQVIRRYGFHPAPFDSRYPRAGESLSNPSSWTGPLPLGLALTRNASGAADGGLTISCSACHNSVFGSEEDLGADGQPFGFHWGRSNDAFDATLFLVDSLRTQFEPLVYAAQFIPYPFSSGHGVSAALGVIDLLGALFDMETLDTQPGLEVFPAHGSSGQVNAPDWWRRSHQTRQWLDAIPSDNVRGAMALSVSDPNLTGAERRALEEDFEDVAVFLESLSPPPYPKEVDVDLAREGAMIFHTKDLWTDPRVEGSPKPPTNGSCAGCHGVYSPSYVDLLPDPRLLGVTGYTVPIEIVRTDPARLDVMSEEMKVMWNTSWWGYDDLHPEWTPEGQGRGGQTLARAANDYTRNQVIPRLEGPATWTTIRGYGAPSLYGAWATAPYFHNGSVPTIWGVLDPDNPESRPDVWRRKLTEPGIGGKNEGFDRSFSAYDWEKLGWDVEAIDCDLSDSVLLPTATCNPERSPVQRIFAPLSNLLGPYLWLGYQVPGPRTDEEVRSRQIVNTHDFSLGNEGHDFTRALSDEDRRAILEYLKTL